MRRPFQRCVYRGGGACSCWDIALWVRRPTLSLLEAEKLVDKGLRHVFFICACQTHTTAGVLKGAHGAGAPNLIRRALLWTRSQLSFVSSYINLRQCWLYLVTQSQCCQGMKLFSVDCLWMAYRRGLAKFHRSLVLKRTNSHCWRGEGRGEGEKGRGARKNTHFRLQPKSES